MRIGKFTEENWTDLLVQFAKVFGQPAADKIKSSDLAKFLASVPYVSCARDPDRSAMAYLLMLQADFSCQVWDYRESDQVTLFRRSETFAYGKGSVRALNDFAIRALTIAAIGGYTAWQAVDAERGTLNPITCGAINGPKVVAKLTKQNLKYYKIWQKAAPTVASQPVDWP